MTASVLALAPALLILAALALTLVRQIEALHSGRPDPVGRVHLAALAIGTAALLGIVFGGA